MNYLLPTNLPRDPRIWGRGHVAHFIRWAEREFCQEPYDMRQFQFNGQALCLLTSSDLLEKAPYAGDVLYNVLQLLLRDARQIQMSMPSTPVTPALWSPYLVPSRSHPPTPSWNVSPNMWHPPPSAQFIWNLQTQNQAASSNGQNQRKDSSGGQGLSTPQTQPFNIQQEAVAPCASASNHVFSTEQVHVHHGKGIVLWEFLENILNDPAEHYGMLIRWKNRETRVFEIVNSEELAKLWGYQKNLPGMTYDKMSRALRYYYPLNILRKVQGERLCYQFLKDSTELRDMRTMTRLRQRMSKQQQQQLQQIELKTEPDEYIDVEY